MSFATAARAAVGDLVANVPLPVPGFGVSIGVDCDGVLYYTQGNSNLYKMNKAGALLATIPIVDAVSGGALIMDEMAWDNGRKIFWVQQHNSNPVRVYKLDPNTGVATFAFTSATISLGSFRDGIAYDATDDSLWISGDVSTTIEHYRACDGGFINQITPKNIGGGTLGQISGVQVGVGDLLYLGRNGATQIVRVRKSDGGFLGVFTSPGGVRDEGLECDAFNFPGKTVLWSRDVNNFVVAIEIEANSCVCQTPCPADIVTCNSSGQCGAVVNFTTTDPVNTTCSPASGSFFPVGTTIVTCTTTNPFCPDIPPATCTFTVTVLDCERPTLQCANITVCNDPGKCSAVVNAYQVAASDNCPGVGVVFSIPPGSTFPKGTTVVTATATDAAGLKSTCTFTVTVNDCEAPTADCVATTNPNGKNVPPASGTNPDGFYQLLASDNCDTAANLQIYIKDSSEGPCGGSFVCGPYAPGTKVKLTQSPGQNSVKPMAGVITDHINTKGEPVMVVMDSSGNTTCHLCLVPPPPK